MPADLQQIVEAARRGDLPLTHHYGTERMGAPDRPWLSEILYALGHDAPEIIADDGGDDDEGAVCRIACVLPDGTGLEVRINYESRPMRVVTAFRLGSRGRHG